MVYEFIGKKKACNLRNDKKKWGNNNNRIRSSWHIEYELQWCAITLTNDEQYDVDIPIVTRVENKPGEAKL